MIDPHTPHTVLKTAFLVLGGYLAVYRTNLNVMPVEAGENLCQVRASRVTEIHRLRDLVGAVRIETAAAALSFLRLQTSPRAFYLLESEERGSQIEVVDRTTLDAGIVFGDTDRLRVLRSAPNGDTGVIDSGLFPRLGLHPTAVHRHGSAFLVDRTLLVHRRNMEVALEVVRQAVSSSGRVRMLHRRRLERRVAIPLLWGIPSFE